MIHLAFFDAVANSVVCSRIDRSQQEF